MGQQLGLSWDEIHGIMERAVQRGLQRRQAEPIRHLGIDEKAFRKDHNSLTVVNDTQWGRVLYVAQPEGIEAVAMDMWDTQYQYLTQTLCKRVAQCEVESNRINDSPLDSVDKIVEEAFLLPLPVNQDSNLALISDRFLPRQRYTTA